MKNYKLLFTYIYIYIYILLSVFSAGMSITHSRRRHPLEKYGAMGLRMGLSPGIPPSKKMWKIRNQLYDERYANALWLNQFLTSYFQNGGNGNETLHAWIQKNFPWVLFRTMGLQRVPAWQEIKQFCYNLMKTRNFFKLSQQDIERETHWDKNLNRQIYELLTQYIQLDILKEKYMNQSTGCGLLHFPNAERRLDHLLNFFKWFDSVATKSPLNENDFKTLNVLLTEYLNENTKQTNLSQTATKMIKDIVETPQTLKKWQHELNSRISKRQIKGYILDYWRKENIVVNLNNDDDDDDDDDDNDDDDNDDDIYLSSSEEDDYDLEGNLREEHDPLRPQTKNKHNYNVLEEFDIDIKQYDDPKYSANNCKKK